MQQASRRGLLGAEATEKLLEDVDARLFRLESGEAQRADAPAPPGPASDTALRDAASPQTEHGSATPRRRRPRQPAPRMAQVAAMDSVADGSPS